MLCRRRPLPGTPPTTHQPNILPFPCIVLRRGRRHLNFTPPVFSELPPPLLVGRQVGSRCDVVSSKKNLSATTHGCQHGSVTNSATAPGNNGCLLPAEGRGGVWCYPYPQC